MPNEYEWGAAFQSKLLAMYIKEPQKAFTIVEPAYFTSPIHVDIARITKQQYENQDRNKVRLSKATLMALVKSSLGKKRREAWPVYRQTIRELFDDEIVDKEIALQQAIGFAKEQNFRAALVEAEKDVNAKNYDRAIERFSKLKYFGVDMDLGIEYWKDPTNPERWREDRKGVIGTFYFPKLDKAMGGGLAQGEEGVILAGGKVGKSTVLARIAAGGLWYGKTVAVATGELSALKYRKRIDAAITQTPYHKLTQLANLTDDDSKLFRKLKQAQNRMQMARGYMKGALHIKEYPTGKARVSDIEIWLDQLKQSGVNIDLLVVDYIRTFRPNIKADEQRLSIGQVCMDLRGLASERHIPVWTASQVNRAALSKENIGPEDFAEDISQFWTLDILVALCQTKAEEALVPQRGRMILTAARDAGRGKTIDIFLDRQTFRVWECGGKS